MTSTGRLLLLEDAADASLALAKLTAAGLTSTAMSRTAQNSWSARPSEPIPPRDRLPG